MGKIRCEKLIEFVKDVSRKRSVFRSIKNCFGKNGACLSDDDMEDIYQESVVVLYNKIGTELTSSKDNALDNFFYGICYRQTLKFLRKQGRVVTIDMGEDSLDRRQRNGISSSQLDRIMRTIPTEGFHSSDRISPEEAVDLRRMKELVHRALDEMAERCRQLLTKYYLEGFNWTEIADALALANADTAKSAAHRCRKRFEEKYKGLEIYVKA